MVDTLLAAFRLLELIALLFPVVALLVQLQHRAVDSGRLERIGLGAGMSLLVLLSISFLQSSLYLITTQSLPSLLAYPLLAMTVISLTLPLLIVLSSERFTSEASKTCSTAFAVVSQLRRRKLRFRERPHQMTLTIPRNRTKMTDQEYRLNNRK
jgi:hypothetical protein